MAPLEMRWVSLSCAAVSPPVKGCEDDTPGGHVGGTGISCFGSSFSGLKRAFNNPSKLFGILKGCFCGGTVSGSGGSCFGAGMQGRGRDRNGSNDFRYVV